MGPRENPAESDTTDQALIADLREAFGGKAEVLDRGASRAAGGGVHSSTVFSKALGGAELPTGSLLGDFEILGELGRGGMGVVYRARQISLGREVALKVLPGYARYGRSGVERFQAEAQAAARLHHTNVVPIYAQGEHDGHYFYAMELVDGVGLDEVIRGEADGRGSPPGDVDSSAGERCPPQPGTVGRGTNRLGMRLGGPLARADFQRLARLVAEVADGLEHAHRSNVIHRDVKPHNLLLGPDRRLHLTDFGLARLADAPHLTASGEVMGTPAYLSPEQIRGGHTIDHRTDIYSLGVTLYELITRRKPFEGETREQVINGICSNEPTAPRRLNHRIPIDLETISLRAMDKDPRRRHPTAALLAEDLRRFADDRPILSRRVSLAEKAAKWVRRHKALTAALTAIVAAAVLAGGWAWSAQNARQKEARKLLDEAYEQLAYYDYRAPELAEADLERAEALDADPTRLGLIRGLAKAGTGEYGEAAEHFGAALEDTPSDQRTWFLLAWAQRHNGDRAAARDALEAADELGTPATADAWFFRGLAVHFEQPTEAIESYRQAVALQTQSHSFYPQAVLHLARARNQLMYKTRNLEGFDEATEDLEQLVKHGYYGAYPHYLLSIAHRLKAEFCRGSSGTRDDSLANEHYAEALQWARDGHDVEPDNDEPFTAESECLESMGRFEEALEARTRSIELATRERRRWEGYHYRWRLHYWLDEYDLAIQDLEVCAEYDPNNTYYAHVYPALVCAEADRWDEALEHARALATDAPDSAQAVLWSAASLRLLGQGDEASALLAEKNADSIDFTANLVPPQSEEWLRALYASCARGSDFEGLEALAGEVASPWMLWGEASFHSGALKLANGDRAGALGDFVRAYRSFDGELRYTYHARIICEKMRLDSAWPPWVGVSLGEGDAP